MFHPTRVAGLVNAYIHTYINNWVELVCLSAVEDETVGYISTKLRMNNHFKLMNLFISK